MRLEKDYLNWAAEASTSTRQYGQTLKAINPWDNVLFSLSLSRLPLACQPVVDTVHVEKVHAGQPSHFLSRLEVWWGDEMTIVVWWLRSTYLSCRWHNWWSPSLIPANHDQTISTSQTGEITWGPSPRSQCRPPSCSCGWRWRAPVCSWTIPRPDCSSSEPDCEPRQAHCDGQRCPAFGLGWPGAPGTSSAGRAESCHRNHRSLGNGRIIRSILPVLRHLCRQA